MIGLTVSRPPSVGDGRSTKPRRRYRAIEWIELAIPSVRKGFGKKPFERLGNAHERRLGWCAVPVTGSQVPSRDFAIQRVQSLHSGIGSLERYPTHAE